jgi:serine/threonine protein kinase
MTAQVPAPIDVIAHYNLLERLEPSGPGDLYRARDTRLGRTVAVRVLPRNFPFPEARSALAREVSTRPHPNVTTLFDIGERDGRVYLVFELQTGQSVRAAAAGRPMNARRAVEVAIQIADAVADAHAHERTHSGLSPDTVVISAKGRVKIPAFDLAVQSGFDASRDDGGLLDYDSPEEARGVPQDDRSDVYSVGAILYEALTTRRPMHRGASAPSASNAKVPPELDEVVLKSLMPNPDARYQSAVGLTAALRGSLAAVDARGAASDATGAVQARSTSVGRVAVTAGATLLAAAVLAWWFWG